MKNTIISLLLILTMLVCPTACARAEADEGHILDLRTTVDTDGERVLTLASNIASAEVNVSADEAEIEASIASIDEDSDVTVEELREIIALARKIYSEYDVVKLDDGDLVFDAAAKKITPEYVAQAEEYTEELNKYYTNLWQVRDIAIELFKLRFSDEATTIIPYNPSRNIYVPLAKFEFTDPETQIKKSVKCYPGSITIYCDAIEERECLYPTAYEEAMCQKMERLS